MFTYSHLLLLPKSRLCISAYKNIISYPLFYQKEKVCCIFYSDSKYFPCSVTYLFHDLNIIKFNSYDMANPLRPENFASFSLPKFSPDTHFVSQNAIRSVAQPLKLHNIPINSVKYGIYIITTSFWAFSISLLHQLGGFYSISALAKNPPAKSLHVSTPLFLISTPFPYQFPNFYIIFTSLKISLYAETISLLHHFSDSYIIADSILSFMYSSGLCLLAYSPGL